MKIRIITLKNVAFDLAVKGDDFDEVVNKIFEKQLIKVNDITYVQTNCIAIIQKLK